MNKAPRLNARIPRDRKSVFSQFGRIFVYGLLLAILIVLIVVNQDRSIFGITSWLITFPTSVVLLTENAVKFWAAKRYASKIVCYTIDILSLMVLTIFTDGTLISILYIIILSEFYLNQKGGVPGSIAMGVSSILIYLITFALSSVFKSDDNFNLGNLLTSAFNDLILFIIHYFAMNFAVQLTRKNRELVKTTEELNNSNEKLRVAYNELKEITALEERQRIAKDIHDTAGHSITTVIMQTEAA